MLAEPGPLPEPTARSSAATGVTAKSGQFKLPVPDSRPPKLQWALATVCQTIGGPRLGARGRGAESRAGTASTWQQGTRNWGHRAPVDGPDPMSQHAGCKRMPSEPTSGEWNAQPQATSTEPQCVLPLNCALGRLSRRGLRLSVG
jgi:hypothetical protein